MQSKDHDMELREMYMEYVHECDKLNSLMHRYRIDPLYVTWRTLDRRRIFNEVSGALTAIKIRARKFKELHASGDVNKPKVREMLNRLLELERAFPEFKLFLIKKCEVHADAMERVREGRVGPPASSGSDRDSDTSDLNAAGTKKKKKKNKKKKKSKQRTANGEASSVLQEPIAHDVEMDENVDDSNVNVGASCSGVSYSVKASSPEPALSINHSSPSYSSRSPTPEPQQPMNPVRIRSPSPARASHRTQVYYSRNEQQREQQYTVHQRLGPPINNIQRFQVNNPPRHQPYPCPKCGGRHNLMHCRDFWDLSMGQRELVVDRAPICRNCFRGDHITRDCFDRFNKRAKGCPNCEGALHNSLLCHKSEKYAPPQRRFH